MPTRVRSHSKINIGLAIGPSRPDGFHALSTVYQTLERHDLVTVEARPAAATSITITCSDPRVPTGRGNTAWRSVEQVLQRSRVPAEVSIHIDKRLPVQGGLGGGSGNAVATLLGLECELRRETGLQLSAAERLRIAAAVGSDVPLFLIGGAVLGVGRGEEVYPLPDLPATPCVLALPEVGVSTPQAYRDWDTLHATAANATGGDTTLTAQDPSATLNELSRSIAAAFSEPHSSGVFSQREGLAENPLLALVRTGIEDDFERVVFPQHPLLGDIKRTLAGSPHAEDAAVYASLSGSGSALYGLYRDRAGAEAALRRLASHQVTGLLTHTLPRDSYWRSMVVGA